jgi:uncharacterized protein YjdB
LSIIKENFVFYSNDLKKGVRLSYYPYSFSMKRISKSTFTNIIILFLIFFSNNITYSQITEVNYQLKYNTDSCWYDAFIIINAGTATTVQQRKQEFSSFSLKVPSGTIIEISKNYFPLKDNETYSGTIPNEWVTYAVIGSPTSDPASDYYSFSPSQDDNAHYNNLSTGDTIRVFSFRLNTISRCGEGISIFRNGIDPGPNAPGMGFIDFSNNFYLGDLNNIYTGNVESVAPPKPLFQNNETFCSLGIEINISLAVNSCQSPFTVKWTGPNNFTSNNEDITINPSTTVHAGTYKAIVTDTYGCKDSIKMDVINKPDAGEDKVVCANSSILIQGKEPMTGIWTNSISNPGGATITNQSNGMANVNFSQAASGSYHFVYTNGTCSDTMSIEVISLPNISFSGPDTLCLGQTSQVSPGSGGFWISNNPAVATISLSGMINSVSAGKTNFTFYENASGCYSTTDSFVVHALPVVSISGPPEVCEGSTTSLIPNSGGIWVSNNPSIAEIINGATVQGQIQGQTFLRFTSTLTGCVSDPLNINVKIKPVAQITGTNVICENTTTQLSPTSNGTWVSTQPAIASVQPNGLVTGLSPGITYFKFTETSTGCNSDSTNALQVVAAPLISLDTNAICVGSFTFSNASTSGTWVSNNPTIASILPNSGLITGLSQGKVTFRFTRSSDLCQVISDTLTISQRPDISAQNTELCVGSTTNLMSSNTGVWTSLDEEVLMIAGNTAIGLSQGFVSVRFTELVSGCENTLFINIASRPQVSITESSSICVGSTSQLNPSSGGTWTSSNISVAQVNEGGLVTGIAQGTASFIFTESTNGCPSLPTDLITVKALPQVILSGTDSICIGSTTSFFASVAGIWSESNPLIATINPSTGVVTGQSAGTTSFTFRETSTGCTSLPSLPVTVIGPPSLAFLGPTLICAGSTTSLSPSSGGTWTSNNISIAIVNNTGQVTSLNPGITTFTFSKIAHGCTYSVTSENLTVTPCFNSDFNITFTNTPVTGSLATNDQDAASNIYHSTFTVVSAPLGSNIVFNINSSGIYSFEADLEGIYSLEIPVCVLPATSNCPSTKLYITVKNYSSSQKLITANDDFAVTAFNAPVTIKTIQNDVCVMFECNPNPATVVVIRPPLSGNAFVDNSNGNIIYTPNSGFSGIVNLTYEVCVIGESTNCDTAIQTITILSQNASNNLSITDDLAFGNKRSILSGNVLLNDIDPEGNVINVIAQNISTSNGDFQLNANGNFIFTPAINFTGPISFVYEVCDNHSISLCKKGTLYFIIFPELSVNIQVYLEGALINNNGSVTVDGRPLMRDNLRVSPFNGSRLIPGSDPYQTPTSYVDVTHMYTHLPPGNDPEFKTVTDSLSVFNVSGRDAIVDWVFVELRSKTMRSQVVATRSALLQRDGDVVDLDGIGSLRFPGIVIDSYYIAVRHRNHLGVMTAVPYIPQLFTISVNFTSPSTPTFDFGTTKNNGYNYTGLAQKSDVKPGYMSMWAGDLDGNKKIKAGNPGDEINTLLFDVLFYPNNLNRNANYNLAIGYFQGDFDLNSKAKFDNPSDDKNMLFSQVLFYPQNEFIIANYNFIIEQLP